MQKLQSIDKKDFYRGNLEFVCDYFVLDKTKIKYFLRNGKRRKTI